MTTASTSSWAADAALQRRRMLTILIGALTIVGLSAIDRRAIFMPWSNTEHPLIDTTPTAFFAQALSNGPGRRGNGPGFPGGGTPSTRFATTTDGSLLGGPVPQISPGIDAAPPAFAAASGPAAAPIGGGTGDGAGGGPAANGPGLPSVGSTGAPVITGSVPETSTWGMMILGFGMVGAAIRRARRRIVPSLA